MRGLKPAPQLTAPLGPWGLRLRAERGPGGRGQGFRQFSTSYREEIHSDRFLIRIPTLPPQWLFQSKSPSYSSRAASSTSQSPGTPPGRRKLPARVAAGERGGPRRLGEPWFRLSGLVGPTRCLRVAYELLASDAQGPSPNGRKHRYTPGRRDRGGGLWAGLGSRAHFKVQADD